MTLLRPPVGIDKKRMLTMQEAMDYLTEKGVPCRSRTTFYRILEDFHVSYMVVNPNGKHAVRRFTLSELRKVTEAGIIAES